MMIYRGRPFHLINNTQLLTYNFHFGNDFSLILIILLVNPIKSSWHTMMPKQYYNLLIFVQNEG